MSIARGIAASIVGPIAGGREGGGGGVSYDSDALDYFSRAEALGGSLDQTGINGTYTEAYIKTAISDFVAGCKTDSIWTKLTEVYLLAGVTFGGLMAKVKYASVATLTNNNFVSGDYLAAGSGAGLVGNGSTKELVANFGAISQDDVSLSCYTTAAILTLNAGRIIGQVGNGNLRIVADSATQYSFRLNQTPSVNDLGSGTSGFYLATRRGATDVETYKDGVSSITNAGVSTAATTGSIVLLSSGGASYADARLSFAGVGTGLTDTDATNLSTRVNALMTTLGANVY